MVEIKFIIGVILMFGYGHSTTAGDYPYTVTNTSVSSTSINITEYIKECAKKVRLAVFKWFMLGKAIDDYREYKIIIRPKVVEVYRRFARPFWTGKNFKKM